MLSCREDDVRRRFVTTYVVGSANFRDRWHNDRVEDTPTRDEICARLERMKQLCDELDGAQTDRRRYTDLIARIRAEADAFRQTLGTHDPKPPAARGKLSE
jgi:hypothetical protein